MLFALGSCRARFNNHQNAAQNFGVVFGNNITKEQAFNDWPGEFASFTSNVQNYSYPDRVSL